MKNVKLLCSTLLTLGIAAIATTGFSMYTIKGKSIKSLSVPVSQIQLNVISQKFLSFDNARFNNNSKIKYDSRYKFITNDKMILPFKFDNFSYLNDNQQISLYSCLKVEINVKNAKLFKKMYDIIKVEQSFLTIKANKNIKEIDSNSPYYYKNLKSNKTENCFQVDALNNDFIIRIPISKETSVKDFYLTNFYTGNYDEKWNFELDLDFDLIDDDKNHSDNFTYDDFVTNGQSNINFNIEMEMLK